MSQSAKNFVVKIGTSGSETDISGYCNQSDFERLVDTLDSTVFGNSDKAFIPGLKDSKFSAGYDYDATIDGILAPLYAVAGKSLVVQPLGAGTGNIQYQVGGFLQDYGASGSVSGKLTGKLTWKCSGVVTRTVL